MIPLLTLPIFAVLSMSTTVEPPVLFATVLQEEVVGTTTVSAVPFYSQFRDIASSTWQKVGCGVTSLAMVIDYYTPDAVTVNTLLKEGIKAGAYIKNAGWSHKGLAELGGTYGLKGSTYDLSKQSATGAFEQFKEYLDAGPVIVSVHYKLDPKNPIPHLVVITGIEGDLVHYNDPASKKGNSTVTTEQFQKAWKKRFIVLRPA